MAKAACSRRSEIVLICISFLVAYGLHSGISLKTLWSAMGSVQEVDIEAKSAGGNISKPLRKPPKERAREPVDSRAVDPASHRQVVGSSTTSEAPVGGLWDAGTVKTLSVRLQRYLEPILSKNGYWIQSGDDWFWQDGSGKRWNTSLKRQTWRNPSHVIPPMVWYGSSFIRELYLETERLQYGITSRNNCDLPPGAKPKQTHPPVCRLSPEDWHVMDSTHPAEDGADCLPAQYAFTLDSMSSCKFEHPMWWRLCPSFQGLEGIDMDMCGPPGFRTSSDLSLAIGFKTFLHSPSADDLFLSRLDALRRDAQLVVAELGTAWGARNGRSPYNKKKWANLTKEEEVDYYVHWVHRVAFPGRLVLWITACGCGHVQHRRNLIEEMWRKVNEHYSSKAVFIDKCVPCALCLFSFVFYGQMWSDTCFRPGFGP